jgi:predicted phosphodiesterase
MFFNKIKTLSSCLFHQMAGTKVSTRIVCISDTHSHEDFILPDGDILIHAGDLTRRGSCYELEKVLNWLKTLTKFRLKIIIAGNHDAALDKTYYEANWRLFHTEKENNEEIINMFNDPTLQNNYGIIYLQDQMFIDPKTQLKFYGRFF